MSTKITDVVINEAIIHIGIDRRSRSLARGMVSFRCFWLNARYRETDPAIYLKYSRTDGNDIGNSE